MSGDEQSVSLSSGLDDEFQKFLNEPLSSDDTDAQLSGQQAKKLWWLDGENGTGAKDIGLEESSWIKESKETVKSQDSLLSSEKVPGHSWLKKPSFETNKREETGGEESQYKETSDDEKPAGHSWLKKSSPEASKNDEKNVEGSLDKTDIEVGPQGNVLLSEVEDINEVVDDVTKEEKGQPVEENVVTNVSSVDEISDIPSGSFPSDKGKEILSEHKTDVENLAEGQYSDASFDSSATKTGENNSSGSQSSSETYKNTFQEEHVSIISSKSNKGEIMETDLVKDASSFHLPGRTTLEIASKPEHSLSEERELTLKDTRDYSSKDENEGDLTKQDTMEPEVMAGSNTGFHKEYIQVLKDEETEYKTEETSEKHIQSPKKEKITGILTKSSVQQSLIEEKSEESIFKNDASVQTTFSRERDTLDKLKESQQIYLEEQKKNSKLKAELISLEKEMKRKLEEQRLRLEQNSYCLQQDNIILAARIEELELRQVNLSSEPNHGEEISSLRHCKNQLEKEVKEQEHLLQGYQQENERLYSELKSVKKELKLNESKFRTKTEELASELSRVREQLRLRERANHFRLSNPASYKEENGTSETLPLSQTLQGDHANDEEVDHLKKLVSSQNEEIQKLLNDKAELSNKVEGLSKKLDAGNLNADHISRQEEEILKLNDHISVLEKERLIEKKAYTQEQIKDHKRIKELENKIRNMEASIRLQTRNPGKSEKSKNNADTIRQLEEQICQLNEQLEMKDQIAKTTLLEIETQYKDIKDEYEKRLKAIELQYCSQIAMLENKLSNVEASPEQISHTASGNLHISKAKLSKASQCSLDVERVEHFISENKELKQKLNKMMHEMEVLKEEHRKAKDDANKIVIAAHKEAIDMISKMKSEMEELKAEHEKSEERGRALIKSAQKEAQEMAQQLKLLHLRELQQAYSDITATHVHLNSDAVAKTADLLNKIETRDIIISQLEQKLGEFEKDHEKMHILEMKNSSLNNQIRELKATLKQIQNRQTPQEKEFWALKEEIEGLERRHIEREDAIQKMLFRLKQQDSRYLKNEVAKWQQRVIEKNKEIEYFRSELDMIVKCLRELKLQGLTVRRPSSAV